MIPVSGAPLRLRALLHESGWRGEGEYRQFKPDQAYPRRATPTTFYATTFQIYRLLVPPWMRYPALCPA